MSPAEWPKETDEPSGELAMKHTSLAKTLPKGRLSDHVFATVTGETVLSVDPKDQEKPTLCETGVGVNRQRKHSDPISYHSQKLQATSMSNLMTIQ